jgi:hypothetical protein
MRYPAPNQTDSPLFCTFAWILSGMRKRSGTRNDAITAYHRGIFESGTLMHRQTSFIPSPARSASPITINGVRWPPDQTVSSESPLNSIGNDTHSVKQSQRKLKRLKRVAENAHAHIFDEPTRSAKIDYRKVTETVDRSVNTVEDYMMCYRWDGYYQKLVESILDRCNASTPNCEMAWDSTEVKKFFRENFLTKSIVLRCSAIDVVSDLLAPHFDYWSPAKKNRHIAEYQSLQDSAVESQINFARAFSAYKDTFSATNKRFAKGVQPKLPDREFNDEYFAWQVIRANSLLKEIRPSLTVGKVYSRWRISRETILPGKEGWNCPSATVGSLQESVEDKPRITATSPNISKDVSQESQKVLDAAEEVAKALKLIDFFVKKRELALDSGSIVGGI